MAFKPSDCVEILSEWRDISLRGARDLLVYNDLVLSLQWARSVGGHVDDAEIK